MAQKTKTEATNGVPIERVVIEPPKFQTATIEIKGMTPYVQHKFSAKARRIMEEKHRQGSVAGSKRKKEPRDFDADCEGATHRSKQGWIGIPASCFRNAAISACRIVGFKMTLAKLSFFVEADGFDEDGTPLVKIIGKPMDNPPILPVRNETGVVDLRCRPMWDDWGAKVRVRWDAAQFSATDVVNLVARAGMQVGIGEGRPDSPNSNGQGWGLFEVVQS